MNLYQSKNEIGLKDIHTRHVFALLSSFLFTKRPSKQGARLFPAATLLSSVSSWSVWSKVNVGVLFAPEGIHQLIRTNHDPVAAHFWYSFDVVRETSPERQKRRMPLYFVLKHHHHNRDIIIVLCTKASEWWEFGHSSEDRPLSRRRKKYHHNKQRRRTGWTTRPEWWDN